MSVQRIPSIRTKKWNVSYRGKFFGDIVYAFAVDLFSKKGKVYPAGKLYPHAINDDYGLEELGIASSFYRANIDTGEAYEPTPEFTLWAATPNKVLRLEDGVFIEDSSQELGETDSGTDLLSVGDETDEDIVAVPVAVALPTGAFSVTGEGDTVKWAQSFKNLGGPFESITFSRRKVGSPTGDVTISIEENDENGNPSGVSLASITVSESELPEDFESEEYKVEDFTPNSLQFDPDKQYSAVLSRSAADADNYVQFELTMGGTDEESSPYKNGRLKSYDGTSWTRTVMQQVVDTLTSSGNWTVPSGVTEATVELWAAGGGGTTDTGGGGGGAYARKLVTGLTPAEVKAVVVGTSSVNADGGDSTFDTNVVVAEGGKSGTNGGAGGKGSNSVGDVVFDGGDGSAGTGARGGGAGAGDSSNGGSANDEIAGIGGSRNGGSGGGEMPSDTSNGGRIIGGGGNSTDSNQYAGARGEARITYYVAKQEGYPTVTSRSWGRGPKNSTTSYSVPYGTMPGDRLVMIASADGSASISVAGWEEVAQDTSVFNGVTQGIFQKVATGNDDGSISTGVSFVIYCIAQGGVATATQADNNSGAPNPPKHDAVESGKYLWIAAASQGVTGVFDTSAPPSNYESFIVEPESFFNDDNRNARTAVADRLHEAASEDPGAFTSGSSTTWVAATVAVPYDDTEIFYDASFSIKLKFPAASERLYTTTKDDVKFLDKNNGIWQSLWRSILQQDALNGDYPRILKSLYAGGTLLLANDNKVHTLVATANNVSEALANRVVAEPTHYAAWVVVTSSSAFIGFNHKKGELLPSFIINYDAYSERTRTFPIPEGATVGYFFDDNCRILDKRGQLRYFTGSSFQPFAYFPTYFTERSIDSLPHRNGIVAEGGVERFLWKGQYPFPAGVWIREDDNLYHRNPIVFDKDTLNSLGTIEANETGALNDDDGIFVGADIPGTNLESVKGIYSSIPTDVSSETRGRIETARFFSQELDRNWQKAFSKFQDGNVIIKHRKSDTPVSGAFAGTWVDSTSFTCDDAAFKSALNDGKITIGDEVTVRKGDGSGLCAHIVSIEGEDDEERTVTLDEGLDVSATDFTFSVENWRKFGNKKEMGTNPSEWRQLKVEMRECAEVEELQISSEANETLNQ